MRMVLMCAVLLGATNASAQSPVCNADALPVTVLGSAADRVAGLTPGDFKLQVNGHAQRVETVNFGVFPHSTYILLDSSGSMTRSRYWQLASEFVVEAAERAPSGDVKVAVFNEHVSKFVDRKDIVAEGKPGIEELLNGGFRNGRTALYDAILAALDTMSHVAPEDTVLVLTDGSDNYSRAEYRQVRARLRQTHTRLSVVLVQHTGHPATREEFGAPENMFELTADSGGTLYAGLPATLLSPFDSNREAPVPEAKEQTRYLAELNAWYRALQSGYRIAVPAPSILRKIKLEIAPEAGRRLRAFYPHAIAPCRVDRDER